jgi:Alkylmercury lyase
MSDFPGGCCPPSDLDRAATAFQRHAFGALLPGEAPRVADVAEAASRDTVGVARAVSWLEAHGRLERDGDLLVGAHGLTRRATAHVLTIGEQRLHTWCAYDAVAIPVALGLTARAATTCPTCGRELVVAVTDGHLPASGGPGPLLWMPLGPCEHVMDDFCVHANLFCSPEHLDTWRPTAGDPAGEVVTLAELPALARRAWADVATLP